MQKSQVDSAALVGAALAATLAVTLLPGPFAWMGSIVGLVLLLVLFGFDQEGYRTLFGSLGFSAVCGLCFALTCGAFFELLAAHGEIHLANGQWQTEWLPFTWAFATVVLWAIDRTRMAGRLSVAERLASRPGAVQRSFIRDTEAAAPIPSAAPPSAPDVATTVPGEPITFEPRNVYPQEPILQQPRYTEPPPLTDSSPLGATRPQSMLTPTTSDVVRPVPAPIIPRAGKEVMIYVALMGEGLNVMRSIRAEHLGRDFYKIIDTMPEGETWQYQPGQVVRCKKQTLSTGKALVAFEEAPRAR